VPDLTARQINIRQRLLSADEGPRADTSAQALARLKPAFSPQGSVTAGNASQSADGAAALVLMSEAALTRYQVEPLARFAGFAVAGVAPELMGIGPVAAVPKLLSRCGRTLAEVGWIELNEAFAAQTLAVIQELGLDPDRVNPMGGAIALGHPLGASGAIRSTTLLHGMRRRQCTYGVVTLCVGTGMGAAALYERA
jgi:acetyl-CoA acyltransferase